MHRSVENGIATIIPFPKRGRFSADGPDTGRSGVQRPVIVEAGACWYHEEAIRDAETKGSA